MNKAQFRIYKTELMFKTRLFIREVNTIDIALTIVYTLYEEKAEDYVITFVVGDEEVLLATYFTDETQLVHDTRTVDF